MAEATTYGRNPAGQRGKLTQENADAIVKAMRGGAYFKDACRHAGIDESTGYRWMAEGEVPAPPERAPHHTEASHRKLVDRWELACKFRHDIEKAEADAKIAALARIRQAGQNGIWTADAWYLERRYPHEFGRRIHEVSGPDGGPIEVSDARDRVASLLARFTGDDDEPVAATSNGNGAH